MCQVQVKSDPPLRWRLVINVTLVTNILPPQKIVNVWCYIRAENGQNDFSSWLHTGGHIVTLPCRHKCCRRIFTLNIWNIVQSIEKLKLSWSHNQKSPSKKNLWVIKYVRTKIGNWISIFTKRWTSAKMTSLRLSNIHFIITFHSS